MLVTQLHSTRGSASTYCVLCLNLIKDLSNIVIHTHTHTSIHLAINMTFHPKNPIIHLSWQLTSSLADIYHAYHIISSKAANKQDITRQKHRNGSMVLKPNIIQTSKHSIQASNKHIHCVHHPKCMFMGMYHSTYASMDGHVNACLWQNKENIKGKPKSNV